MDLVNSLFSPKPDVVGANTPKKLAIPAPKELNKKVLGLWQCTGYTQNPSGGLIYSFKPSCEGNLGISDKKTIKLIKDIWATGNHDDAVQYLNQFLFPAESRSLEDIRDILSQDNCEAFAAKLGFSIRDKEIGLPDAEAITRNWETIFSDKSVENPGLQIFYTEDTATDEDFVTAYINGKFPLSIGGEVIHDSLLHIFPLMKLRYLLHTEKKIDFLTFMNILLAPVLEEYEMLQRLKNIAANPKGDKKTKDFIKNNISKLWVPLGALMDNTMSGNIIFSVYKILTESEGKNKKANEDAVKYLRNIADVLIPCNSKSVIAQSYLIKRLAALGLIPATREAFQKIRAELIRIDQQYGKK